MSMCAQSPCSVTAGAAPSSGAGTPAAPLADVAVVAARQLVGEAVQTALAAHRHHVSRHGLPSDRRRAPEVARRIVEDGARVVVVLCDVTDQLELGDAAALVRAATVPCVVLTEDAGPGHRAFLASLGAAAVLPMSTRVDDLDDILALATAGASLVPVEEAAWRDQAAHPLTPQHDQASRLARLTRREVEVLEALVGGSSVQEIAASTGLSVGTVRTHVKSVLRKLGVSSQLAAVAAYRRAHGGPPSGRSGD